MKTEYPIQNGGDFDRTYHDIVARLPDPQGSGEAITALRHFDDVVRLVLEAANRGSFARGRSNAPGGLDDALEALMNEIEIVAVQYEPGLSAFVSRLQAETHAAKERQLAALRSGPSLRAKRPDIALAHLIAEIRTALTVAMCPDWDPRAEDAPAVTPARAKRGRKARA